MLLALLRVTVSALVVGLIATGTSLHVVLQDGHTPTTWQLYSALVSGAVLALNDVKSRLTPPP